MARKKSQFDTGLSVFDILVTALFTFCAIAANVTKLGISTVDMGLFTPLYNAFKSAYAISKVKATASVATRGATKKARKDLTAFLRTFVKKYFYDNTLADSNDISNAGLSARTIPHGPYDTPTVTVSLKSSQEDGHVLKVVYRESITNLKGKPDGVKFVRIRYFIGANPPANPNDWTLFVDFTKNPALFLFLTNQAGSAIIFSACYIGTNGKEGPYGKTHGTVIG